MQILKKDKLVFYAWGKQNMGQFMTDSDDNIGTLTVQNTAGQYSPRRLAALPSPSLTSHYSGSNPAEVKHTSGCSALEMVEVWCGSEFTIAADSTRGLWGCGWNEHGNLGSGELQLVTEGSGGGDGELTVENNINSQAGVSGTNTSTSESINSIDKIKIVNSSNNNPHSVQKEWKPVVHAHDDSALDQQAVRLLHVWEGALSCGGGHVVCFGH
jgi:hypothetical protein